MPKSRTRGYAWPDLTVPETEVVLLGERPANAPTQASDPPRPDPGGLRLAVVADTHGRPHPAAADLVARSRPDIVLHAGDIGAPESGLAPFSAASPHLLAVRGNIDDTVFPIARVLSIVEAGGGGRERLRLLLTHIAVQGLGPSRSALAAARAAGCDLIVCGHSHVPFLTRTPADPSAGPPVTLFNPGSIGPRRFRLPIVFGLIDLWADGVTSFRHIDCETGLPWSPP